VLVQVRVLVVPVLASWCGCTCRRRTSKRRPPSGDILKGGCAGGRAGYKAGWKGGRDEDDDAAWERPVEVELEDDWGYRGNSGRAGLSR
jgi:hypothetical protein